MIANVMDDLSDHTLQPGDRVEVLGGNRFGTVLATRPDPSGAKTRGVEILAQLSDGSEQWLRQSQAWYAPPLEVIGQRLEVIQDGWSKAERRSRSGLILQEQEPLTVPIVHDQWDAAFKTASRRVI